MKKIGKIAAKTVLWVMGILLALTLLLFVLIRIPAVQNYVVQKVTAYLEKKIETPFRIGRVGIDFPKMLVIENLYVEDRNRDTLLAGEKIRVDINLLRLLRNVVEVNRIDLIGVTGQINRTLPDQTFNFEYIIDAFVDPNKEPEPVSAPADSTAPLVISIDRINLERIHVIYHDEVIGLSTDIHLGSLKTRIKTFDLTGDMHFAVPQLEIAGLNGRLEQWTSPVPSDTTTSALPELELGLLNLTQIDFAYRNTDMGLDSRFSWEKLVVEFDELDLKGSRIAFEQIALDQSASHLIFAKTEQTEEPTNTEADTTEGSGWYVTVNQLLINQTDFLYRDDNQTRVTSGFDYSNIGITGLHGHLQGFTFSADSIGGTLESLQAKDHSGFEIKQLSSTFSYTDQGAELAGLYAETPHTRLQDYLQIRYPSLDRITERPGELEIRADLKNSHLGMRDVLYFLPDLDTMEVIQPLLAQTIHIDGQVSGRMDKLEIPSLQISTLDQTKLDVSATISGLPDMDRLHADLIIRELTTGKADLDHLLAPGLLPDSIQLPADMRLSGILEGGMTAFETDLELRTSDGHAAVAGTFRTGSEAGVNDTTYQAQIAIMDVNLGQILRMDSLLGNFSLSAAIEGRGLDPKTMVATIDGELIGMEAMGYTYHDILLNARAEHGEVQAEVISNDTNVDFDLQAMASLGGTYPSLQLELMIDSINLKRLNLMEEEFRYHGRLVADLETADIDHLNGTVEILNSSIAYNDDRYTFSSFKLLAASGETSNMIQLTSEFLNAHLVGNYQLSQLNHAIKDIIAIYYQPDSVAPVYEYNPQQFDFSAKLTRSKFIREFLPELTEMRDITLDGSFNSEDKFLLVKAIAPRLTYAGTEITDVGLDITTFDSTMYYSALIRQIAVSDLELTNTLLSGTVLHNQLDFGLWIKDQEDVERYHLGVGMKVDAGNFVISLLENGLMLNYDEWDIHPENALIFGKDGIHTRDFILSQGDQRMMVMSQYEALNSPIDMIFENFRIETFSKMLESEVLNMGGGINGLISLSRLESNPIFISDIEIDQFYFGNDTVGNIVMNVNNTQNNTYAAKIDITGNGNQVSLNGSYLALPDQVPQLNFVLDLQPMTMKTLEAFSMGYLRQTAGTLNGQLNVTGTIAEPRLNGELVFREAAMNVGMINANFLADNQRIQFDNQGIRFNRFELRDSKNNIARLNGTVNTSTYRDFIFNLTLNADEFQVLNSTKKDLDIFYGQLFVTTNLRVTGGLNSPVINGNLHVDEHTNVTFVLPNNDPGLVERDGIIQFVNRSDTSAVNVFARLDSMTTTELSGLRLSMNIQTHEDAAFSIVIDEGSGDALNIQGSADLTAGIDPSGNITLTGTYTVEEGNYSFTFEPVKRVFDFKQGSTITWAGDPMDARLDITAVYNVKAPTLELVQGQISGESQNLYKQRVPFNVNLGITGQMLQPELHFDIDLDEDNSMISQDVASKVNTALNQLEDNESEMNKQVFALIVLGRFMAANPFESVSGGSAGSIARNSVSSLLSAQLNRFAGDLIRGVELDFDLQSGDDYSTGQSMTRTDLNIGVSKMLLDDRLKVTIGSNFELEGNARPGEQTTNIAGDIAVDYQLSESGRYILRVYRKNQYQVTLQGQYVETGLGFIINMDYNQFREIFMTSKELADLYSTDTRDFQRRFDRDRMETDSVYRDSVRSVLRDSLQRVDPTYRDRIRRRQSNDSTSNNQGNPPVSGQQPAWIGQERRNHGS